MKKIIKLIIYLVILIIIFELIVLIFKQKHFISYKIKDNQNTFVVEETYKNNKYYLSIDYKSKKFSFDLNNVFYKSKKILKDIKLYTKDNLVCIYPIFKNDITINIECNEDNKLYSYNKKSSLLTDFVNNLKKEGYNNNSWIETDDKINKIGKVTVYMNNLIDNTYIYLWKYDGFYTVNKENLEQLNIFDNDTYLNNLGISINKYYLIPNYNQEYEFNEMYIFNMENNKKKTIKFKEKIARDSYINGVVDNKLYLLDKDDLLQYEINPKKKKYVIVGSKDKDAVYYDGTFTEKNIYDFKNEEIIFENKIDVPKEIDSYTYIYNEDNMYYYKDKDNFYSYNLLTGYKILLFTAKDIADIKITDGNIYYIKDNELYVYTKESGTKKILSYEELSFNSKNRYAIYKK